MSESYQRGQGPGSDAWPADVLIPSWSVGTDTTMNITVINPMQVVAFVSGASVSTDHALSRRYGEKMTKHGEDCKRAGLVFIPLTH